MRVFDLPQKDLESSFNHLLDYVEKSIATWEHEFEKPGAFSDFEPTAIIKKTRSGTNQNKVAETENAKQTVVSRLTKWQLVMALFVLTMGFILLVATVLYLLGAQ